ncbi:hypothetical protein T4B_5836, partial [Trichinella pseudospiralis]
LLKVFYFSRCVTVLRNSRYNHFLNIWIRKKRKSENADDTKQNSGMKTYGICGSPRVPIL